MKCLWIFNHNWSKWTRPFEGHGGYCRQYKECKDCGTISSKRAPFQYGGKEGGGTVSEELGVTKK